MFAGSSTETVFTSPPPAGECDPSEEEIKRKVLKCKSIFHMGRHLEIRKLPMHTTEAEIRELLSDFPVGLQKVRIVNSNTSSSTAKIFLEDPKILEDWDCNRNFFMRRRVVKVAPTPTEMMLCVARLPLYYTEEQFTALVSAYGAIQKHFLMISEKTGKSKGYGFVKYFNFDCAILARNTLNNKQIDDSILVCDWLDSGLVTYKSLQSKCLYVDHLPKYCSDNSELRKIFSAIVNPPYCQIALKNGCLQDWGLVEFSNWEDAEIVHTKLNGCNLGGQHIRISYHIPGVCAINLYLKLLNDSGPVKTEGLLPKPSIHVGNVFNQCLQNMFKQNHSFPHLQNIIESQRQASEIGRIAETCTSQSPGRGTASSTKIIEHQIANNGKGLQGPTPNITTGIPVSSFQGIQQNGNILFQPSYPPPLPQNIEMAGTSSGDSGGRRQSWNSMAPGEVPTLPRQLDNGLSYWALPQHQLASPTPSPVVQVAYPSQRDQFFNIPPPFNHENGSNQQDKLKQHLITSLDNPKNWQLPSIGQAPLFSYPLNPRQSVDDIMWRIPQSAISTSMSQSPIHMVQSNQTIFSPASTPPTRFSTPSLPQLLIPPYGTPTVVNPGSMSPSPISMVQSNQTIFSSAPTTPTLTPPLQFSMPSLPQLVIPPYGTPTVANAGSIGRSLIPMVQSNQIIFSSAPTTPIFTPPSQFSMPSLPQLLFPPYGTPTAANPGSMIPSPISMEQPKQATVLPTWAFPPTPPPQSLTTPSPPKPLTPSYGAPPAAIPSYMIQSPNPIVQPNQAVFPSTWASLLSPAPTPPPPHQPTSNPPPAANPGSMFQSPIPKVQPNQAVLPSNQASLLPTTCPAPTPPPPHPSTPNPAIAAIPSSMFQSPIPKVQPNQAVLPSTQAPPLHSIALPPTPPPPPPPPPSPPNPPPAGSQQSSLPQALLPKFDTPKIIWNKPTATLITAAPATNPSTTPVVQKRKFLPDPTPGGGIVGQHSQGIGGHHADSFKRNKK